MQGAEMFLCERLPGSLQLTKQACAKHWHRAKNMSGMLQECLFCENGEQNYNNYPNLTWRHEWKGENKGEVSRLSYLKDRDEFGESIPDEVNESTRKPMYSRYSNNLDQLVFPDCAEHSSINFAVKELMLSVLNLSLNAFLKSMDKSEQRRNRHWLCSKKRNWVFSCQSICDTLGIEQEKIIQFVKNMEERGS